MSNFRLLVEETLESIKTRKTRVNILFNRIKRNFLEKIDQCLEIYNEDQSVEFDLKDDDYIIKITLKYDPELIHKQNTFMMFSYDLNLEKKLCYIDIFVDKKQLTPKMLGAYVNSVMFDTRLKHELLHYLDEKQSNFKINVPDYFNIDNKNIDKIYFNRPEEIHAILYSAIDRLKGKKVNVQDKTDIIRVIKETDKETGEMVEDFFTEADPKNVNKFIKSLYNALN